MFFGRNSASSLLPSTRGTGCGFRILGETKPAMELMGPIVTRRERFHWMILDEGMPGILDRQSTLSQASPRTTEAAGQARWEK